VIKSFTTLMIIAGIITLSAQTETDDQPKYGWQKEAIVSLNLTQSSFDNYSQGGENSTAWQFRSGLKFVNDQEKINWANTGKFEFGELKSGEDEAKKSADEIKLESVLTYKIGKLLNPFLSATGETQFAPGYMYKAEGKDKISQFLDPGYFREAIGIGYKPSDVFQARLGAAMKQTVSDMFNHYSDDPKTSKIEKLKNEIGAESVWDLNYKVTQNSLLKSKMELFSNLKAFDEIDVIWDTDLTTKITRLIAFNFNVKLIYDKDISYKRQIKQVMGVGLSYSLF